MTKYICIGNSQLIEEACVGIVVRLRSACGWEWSNVTKYVLVLGIVGILRLTCGWEWLSIAENGLSKQGGRPSGRVQKAGEESLITFSTPPPP